LIQGSSACGEPQRVRATTTGIIVAYVAAKDWYAIQAAVRPFERSHEVSESAKTTQKSVASVRAPRKTGFPNASSETQAQRRTSAGSTALAIIKCFS
jgi:hypothetical protein